MSAETVAESIEVPLTDALDSAFADVTHVRVASGSRQGWREFIRVVRYDSREVCVVARDFDGAFAVNIGNVLDVRRAS